MTREEIISMALDAGLAFPADEFPDIWQLYMNAGRDEISRFANLVAAAEREACAKACDHTHSTAKMYTEVADICAKRIRARGKATN